MLKVFISYSQESDAHKARVLALAQALRRDGVEVELDQFYAHRILDWPRWCLQQLRKADFVLCVCTREYRDRVYGDVPASTGKGVHWEGSVLDDEFYRKKGNDRVLPVLLMPEVEDSIPDFMRGWTYCRLSNFDTSDAGYEHLYRILTHQPGVTPQPVGTLLNLPPKSATGASTPAVATSGVDVAAMLSTAIAAVPAGSHAVSVQSCTVHVGVSITELLPLLEAEKGKATAPLRAQLDALAVRLGLTEEAIRNFLRILGERDIPADQLAERFAEIVQRHRDTLQRLTVLAADDPADNGLIEQARTAMQAGDYDEADRLLAESENADLIVARQAQSLALAAQAATRQHFLTAAATRAERGDLAMTRIDYLTAAEHFRQAAASVPAEDSEARADYLHRQASALYQQGNEFGDNAALLNAIAIWRKTLELRPRERVPLNWATTQNNLGTALSTLGERESGTARLQEAVAAYHAALEEFTRERVPLDWAMTQNNLGTALRALGERESDTARLQEAVAAYRAALEERSRERVPLDWAMTQNNLGTALTRLGERESGTARLEEAVAAYRAALEVFREAQAAYYIQKAENNLQKAEALLAARRR